MDKQDIWFSVSLLSHRKMKEYAEMTGLPRVRSKFLLYLLHNYSPKELQTDYSFSHSSRKMICAKLTQQEVNFITGLESKYNRNTSALARDMVYSFLKENGAL